MAVIPQAFCSASGTAGTFSGFTDFIIGQNGPDDPARHFVGALDEIRVYPSALPDAEIAAHAWPVTRPPFRITAFNCHRAARTMDVSFLSESCAVYTLETSLDGQIWPPLGAPVPGVAGATSTTVTGRTLPPPVTNRLLLRVRRA
ncbi:MAG: hypothetical protein KA004_14080 [Verrucomicrobiales bacterium]|nr:hypothetical protein [Verrucomicrobiales bacterium]